VSTKKPTNNHSNNISGQLEKHISLTWFDFFFTLRGRHTEKIGCATQALKMRSGLPQLRPHQCCNLG
jgi:hypothetical protein